MTNSVMLKLIAGVLIGMVPFGCVYAQVESLSQSLDESSVVPRNSFVCESSGFHFSSSYYRSFDLKASGLGSSFFIDGVAFGIESVRENNTGNGADVDDGFVPLTINFYWNTPLSAIVHSPIGNSPADGSVDVLIPGDGSIDLSVIEIPIFGVGLVPVGATDLVVEIFSPGADGPNPNDDLFIIGSNSGGQMASSFVAAAACNTLEPTDTADIGFPNMHVVLVVDVREFPCCECSGLLGDVDHSGQVNLADVNAFVDLLLSGKYQCEADTNFDLQVNLQDVFGFVEILTGGG